MSSTARPQILVGDKLVDFPELLPGDRAIAIGALSELIVISAEARRAVSEAVANAQRAFVQLSKIDDVAVTAFFREFAARLDDASIYGEIARANASDVEAAKARGRHIGRLVLSEKMRRAMIDGLRGWAASPTRIGEIVERRSGEGFSIERRRAPLGVIAFVFEGRPNVFADAAGVLRNKNAAVLRIGSDALGTAMAIEERALRPALERAALPVGALTLIRNAEHGAAQALFCETDVRLAVARGSGRTVTLLGAIAKQHGIPVSLHGTGGAWMLVEASASPELVTNAVTNSLDRKVCNTLNVLMLERRAVDALGGVLARALEARGAKVHVCRGSEGVVAATAEAIDEAALATEWEWDDAPELSFLLVDDLNHAATLMNRHSPKFVASILSGRPLAFEQFYAAVEAPYVSNAFTRWVDGQWAWDRPELGLTNWETGRLLGRSGFLSGDDITTIRDVFLDHTGRGQFRR
ncbi:MAG TPA: aldehyde dehydrogenase family protein [Polyangiaceae bacterium]